MKHKLVVFDWNGTILSDTQAAWKAGNECLKLFGVAPISLRHYRDTFTFPIIHFYVKNGCSVDDVVKKQNETAVFQETYEDLAKNARTRTGVRVLLDWLKGHGVSCIILSNYQTDKIKEQLERLKLEPYFQYVSAHECDGSTILHKTTKTGRLSDFMVKRGYKPGDAVIIGDSAEEPDIARDLGLVSIGITDGCISRTRLKKATPDYIVHDMRAVKDILSEKWGLPL